MKPYYRWSIKTFQFWGSWWWGMVRWDKGSWERVGGLFGPALSFHCQSLSNFVELPETVQKHLAKISKPQGKDRRNRFLTINFLRYVISSFQKKYLQDADHQDTALPSRQTINLKRHGIEGSQFAFHCRFYYSVHCYACPAPNLTSLSGFIGGAKTNKDQANINNLKLYKQKQWYLWWKCFGLIHSVLQLRETCGNLSNEIEKE